jgi:hypothetical protein
MTLFLFLTAAVYGLKKLVVDAFLHIESGRHEADLPRIVDEAVDAPAKFR